MLSEKVKIVQVYEPTADFANGSPDTAVVAVGGFKWATFVVNMGVNTGGAGRIGPILKVCAVNAKTNAQAVGGWYRHGTKDAPGTDSVALTRFEAASEPSLAAGNCDACQAVYELDIEEARKVWGTAGYDGPLGVFMNVAETNNDLIVGSVTVILSDARYAGGTHTATVLA